MKTIFTPGCSNRILATLLFLGLLFTNIQAATITWLGGDGYWNDAAGWDAGTVPTGNDVAIINSGYVKTVQGTWSSANRVFVGNNATLYVQYGSTLNLEDASGAPAIENEGLLDIVGTLNITAAYNGGNTTKGGRGILNNGTTIVRNTGEIDCYEIEHTAIENGYSGFFKNYGTIEISEVLEKGIFNNYLFDNYGTIDIFIASSSNSVCITNRKVFRNHQGRNINLNGANRGIANIASGRFYNWGNLDIENTASQGISNDYRFYNKSNGSITINNTGNSGISSSNRFYNQGDLVIDNSGWSAIFNLGDFYNTKYLQTGNAQVNTIWNYGSGSYFSNSGMMQLENNTNSIQTNGTFENQNTGRIYATHRIFAYPGILSNYGIITNTYPYNGSFSSNSSFLNEGIIEDVFGVSGIMYNDEVILAPINGTLQNGIPFPNALNLSDYDNVIYGKIYNDENKSKAVGDYDYKTNEIIPNESAVGLTELYFDLTIKGTNNSKMCVVKLNNPILPYVTNGHNQFAEENARRLANEEVIAFPNPTRGLLNLSGEMLNKTATSIVVYNTLGQEVANFNYGKFDAVQFQFPTHLTNGMYTLQIIQEDKAIATKRVKLLRE